MNGSKVYLPQRPSGPYAELVEDADAEGEVEDPEEYAAEEPDEEDDEPGEEFAEQPLWQPWLISPLESVSLLDHHGSTYTLRTKL